MGCRAKLPKSGMSGIPSHTAKAAVARPKAHHKAHRVVPRVALAAALILVRCCHCPRLPYLIVTAAGSFEWRAVSVAARQRCWLQASGSSRRAACTKEQASGIR